MKIILDDISDKEKMYPFSYTRSIADIRIGILTIREKWEKITGQKIFTTSEINNYGESAFTKVSATLLSSQNLLENFSDEQPQSAQNKLQNPWNIFQYNHDELIKDFALITKDKTSNKISDNNRCISPENIFIEDGAVVEHSIINASTGPVYIGKNAQVMEGCLIRGPFALCENSILKMGAKVYGATTIGPSCVAGGEIKNSVLSGYSNKAHDGYLGDSVIGEWCNIGGGSSNSNIKNTGGTVNVWNNAIGQYSGAGSRCGVIMGDYTRCAINTSFNTGTVTGVCCNIFGNINPPKYVPDFSWGNEKYILEKALQDIDNWKKFKGKSITEKEINLLSSIYLSQKIYHA